jgi:hypothetical protein
MKYKVRITKQPRYQDGGAPALGDFSNMTQDQLENGPVYGFRSEPEAQSSVVVPGNNQRVSMQELQASAGRIPSYSPNIVPVPVDPRQLYTRPQYTGASIVDYLNQLGLPTSRSFRTNLAKEYGIKNYTGTATQNKQLISILDNLKDNFIDFGGKAPSVAHAVRHASPHEFKLSYDPNSDKAPTWADFNSRPEIQQREGFTPMQGLGAVGAMGAAALLPELIPSVRYFPMLPAIEAATTAAGRRVVPKLIQKAGTKLIEKVAPRLIQAPKPTGWFTGSGNLSSGFPFYQEGGEQDNQMQQVLQAVAQMLQQGASPEQVMQQLMQKGMPKEMTQQVVQTVMQQMQGMQGQNPEEEQMEPQMAYGGQMGYGLDLGARRLWMNQNSDNDSEVTDSIEEVPREQANIEAEGGETALIPYQKDGTYIHKKIKGNRHTEGGVPLNVPEGTFIYSDTKKMKLGGPVLQMFGKSEKSTKKFTPATLAKQYNIDKYKAIMDDPKSDPIKKRTAELMLQNFQKKLSQLALVQESKKGFPQGIPEVARDYYQQMQQMQQAKQGGQSVASVNQSQQQGEQPQAMYGMGFQYGGNTPETKVLGDDLSIANAARRIYLNPGDLDNWMNQVGRINPITQIARGISSGIVNTGAFLGNRNLQHEVDNTDSIYQNQKRLLQSRGVPFEYGGGLYEAQDGVQYSTVPEESNYVQYPHPTEDKREYDFLGKRPRISMDELNPSFAKQPNTIPNAKENLEIPKTSPYTDINAFTKKVSDEYKNFTPATPVYDNTFSDKWSNLSTANLANAFINDASIKRPTPFEPTVKLDRAETYYTDPSRALAASAEQMNAARQAAAMLTGPAGRHSFNAGQYGANAANIISQYAMQNVGIGNTAAQQNAAINNQQMQYDVQRAKRLYDAGVIGEQQYQNAKRQSRAAILQAYGQGEEESANRFNLSQFQSPYYGVDSRNRVRFKSGQARTDFFNAKNNQDTNPFFQMVNMLMNDSNGKLTYKDAVEAAAKIYGRQQMNNAS